MTRSEQGSLAEDARGHRALLNSLPWRSNEEGDAQGRWMEQFAASQREATLRMEANEPRAEEFTEETRRPSGAPAAPIEVNVLEPSSSVARSHQDQGTNFVLSRLTALEEAVAELGRISRTSRTETSRLPPWLTEALQTPHRYEEYKGSRTNICMRIRPETYKRAKETRARLGLKTVGAMMEYLLALGLLVVERVPPPPGQPPPT